MVTHSPARAARAGRIVNLLDGRIVDAAHARI
jgi:predicted ABC-type transport system involved in lysophospholipase L1 biosynthesis ATPase subunit